MADQHGDALPLDRHPRFRRLFEYLGAKAPPGKLPGRQHVDPVEIRDLLPYVMLIEVVRASGQADRYRIRLMGTEVVALQGSDGTGMFVEDVLTKGPDVIAGYADIVTSGQPQYRQGEVAAAGRDHLTYQRIAFPLAADGQHVDMLMFVFAIDQPSASTIRRESDL
jgi:PAS domain